MCSTAMDEAIKERDHLEQLLEEREEELQQAHQHFDEQTALVKSLTRQLEQLDHLKDDLENRDGHLKRLNADWFELSKLAEQYRKELEQARAERDEAKAELTKLKEQLERVNAEAVKQAFEDGLDDTELGWKVLAEQAIAERDQAINSALCIEDLEKVKHALGVGMNVKRSSWGYRNRYVCVPDASTDRLISSGLFELASGPSDLLGGSSVFRATVSAMDLFCVPKKSEARKDAEWRRNR